MTRRLAWVIAGVVLATLLIAGAGTLALATARARSATEDELHAQATALADGIGDFLDVALPLDTAAGQTQLRNRLRLLERLRQLLPVDEVAVIPSSASGAYDLSQLPTGVTLSDTELARAAAGETVSGTDGRTSYALAVGQGPARRDLLVVVSRKIDAQLGPAVRLFAWAAALTLGLGLVAAMLLGRRLTRPVRDVSLAAQRIAAGELSTRVEQPDADEHDEIAELQRSINAMAASLERSRGLEQQFLLSVSHDLRTPLTSIRGYADAIDDGTVEPARAAAIIRSEARRLDRLVADLLDLAKLESRAFSLHIEPVDLAAAVHTAVDNAATSAPPGIAVHPFTSGALAIDADPDRLAQVLANLLENATRYARTRIDVTARTEDGSEVAATSWATVTVDDDGPGISAQDLPHVFERLYVARHQPERRESSSGLGLAIVRELVQAMGGTVAAGGSALGGARMTVRFPLRPR